MKKSLCLLLVLTLFICFSKDCRKSISKFIKQCNYERPSYYIYNDDLTKYIKRRMRHPESYKCISNKYSCIFAYTDNVTDHYDSRYIRVERFYWDMGERKKITVKTDQHGNVIDTTCFLSVL